jgi:hypothetical protein
LEGREFFPPIGAALGIEDALRSHLPPGAYEAEVMSGGQPLPDRPPFPLEGRKLLEQASDPFWNPVGERSARI